MLNRIVHTPLRPQALEAFREWELSLEKCGREVTLTVTQWPPIRELLQSHVPKSVSLDEITAPSSLWEGLHAVTKLLARHDDNKRKLYAEAARQGLGWYTVEQEADEIAMELLSQVGIPLQTLIEEQLSHLKWKDEAGLLHPIFDVPYETCQQWIKAGWNTGGAALPIGSISDLHHDSCYRAYNMAREIQAHGYTDRPSPIFVIDQVRWATLKRELPD